VSAQPILQGALHGPDRRYNQKVRGHLHHGQGEDEAADRGRPGHNQKRAIKARGMTTSTTFWARSAGPLNWADANLHRPDSDRKTTLASKSESHLRCTSTESAVVCTEVVVPGQTGPVTETKSSTGRGPGDSMSRYPSPPGFTLFQASAARTRPNPVAVTTIRCPTRASTRVPLGFRKCDLAPQCHGVPERHGLARL